MWTSLFTCSFRHLSLYNPVHFTLTALAIWSSCISRVQLPRISASCRVGQHRFGQFWKFVLLHFYHWAAMIILLRCYSVDSTPPWKSDSQDVDSQKDFSLIMAGDGDCSHEIKRRLLLGRKVMTNLDSILKSRDITLPTKVRLVKAMVFPVAMYGCECWTVKKTEC